MVCSCIVELDHYVNSVILVIANTIYHPFRPNPLQYFLVPDIEVENGAEDDEEDLEEEEDVDESVCLYFLLQISQTLSFF